MASTALCTVWSKGLRGHEWEGLGEQEGEEVRASTALRTVQGKGKWSKNGRVRQAMG